MAESCTPDSTCFVKSFETGEVIASAPSSGDGSGSDKSRVVDWEPKWTNTVHETNNHLTLKKASINKPTLRKSW